MMLTLYHIIIVIGASLSEPHTRESGLSSFPFICIYNYMYRTFNYWAGLAADMHSNYWAGLLLTENRALQQLGGAGAWHNA